jgi:hypothetical protein
VDPVNLLGIAIGYGYVASAALLFSLSLSPDGHAQDVAHAFTALSLSFTGSVVYSVVKYNEQQTKPKA